MDAFLEGNLQVLRALAALRTPVLDTVMSLITRVGEEAVFLVVALGVFWCVDKYRGYFLLLVGFAGTVLNQFLKLLCRIPRPWVLDPEFRIVERARAAATGYSFPSGHTQNAVGTFGVLARTEKDRRFRVGFIVIAALVGFSRLYLGVHTPFDVVVAAATAVALVFLIDPLYRRMEEKPRLLLPLWVVLLLGTALFRRYAVSEAAFFGGQVTLDELSNFSEAVKNANSMLGAGAAAFVVYILDYKFIHFETKAVWWAQLLKLAGGTALVLAVKTPLKQPLYALLGPSGDIVRYFLVVLVAGAVWPLTFRWFAKLGASKSK